MSCFIHYYCECHYFERRYAECHYAERRYAQCHGAFLERVHSHVNDSSLLKLIYHR